MNDVQKTKIVMVATYLQGRLKEPSTWAGIALFVGLFGVSPDTVDRMTSNAPAIIAALGALIAIFAPSGSRKALDTAREAKTIATNTADDVSSVIKTL